MFDPSPYPEALAGASRDRMRGQKNGLPFPTLSKLCGSTAQPLIVGCVSVGAFASFGSVFSPSVVCSVSGAVWRESWQDVGLPHGRHDVDFGKTSDHAGILHGGLRPAARNHGAWHGMA